MNKIKKTFNDWRNSTPKRAQWLLLGVAFVVVLILMTLVLMGGEEEKKIEEIDATPIELVVAPDSIDWPDVTVGQAKTQIITVSATGPIKIVEVRRDKNINGLSVTTGCTNAGEISAKFACTITIDYAPTTAMTARGVPIFIDWHGVNQPENMKKSYKYTMVLGAVAPVAETKPEPVPVVTPPVTEEVEEEIEEFIDEEPEEEIEEDEIELIAPANPFVEDFESSNAPEQAPEACSDFAFPGYDNSGRQIGWIKPKGGAYYFHPFSDKTCENPTGVYNPDNGIITDIKNKSKKIGTDADHIGYATITNGVLPELASLATKTTDETKPAARVTTGAMGRPAGLKDAPPAPVTYGTSAGKAIVASQPYDRSFVLRQYKPIPATIVSDVRADADVFEKGKPLPVRATVDRNVYSDDGRNIIIPTGTMMLGYVTGELPGPYKTIGRMQINWYQFIRPDGVEFNFGSENVQPFAGDAQGRVGVPGRGSSDYIEQFFMPMLTAIVPAAVNLIAPVTDAFVNQIDLDNNTVVQSGTVRSSELAKNEIITAWNQVAQKLLVDMMDNTVPPFTIAAGTRITVYSPEDLVVVCADENQKCYVESYYKKSTTQERFDYNSVQNFNVDKSGPDWVGQVRSFAVNQCCQDGKVKDGYINIQGCDAYDYRTLVFYCQSSQYQAINMAKQDALYKSQQKQFEKYEASNTGQGLAGVQGNKEYNEQVLGLTYDEEGYIKNPFEEKDEEVAVEAEQTVLTCEDGSMPDANGCCAGEIYTDMGDMGFNCCPEGGGDCFPPIL